MANVEDLVKISPDRVGAVIGRAGKTRRDIEKACSVKLKVGSASGEVRIIRKTDGTSQKAVLAREVIGAIAMGFAPDKALRLLEPDIYLEKMPLSQVARNKKDLQRIKSRIIGKKGKARETIAANTKTNIVIYDESVSIIGEAENIHFAREAIERIVKGTPHSAVFKFVEKQHLEQFK